MIEINMMAGRKVQTQKKMIKLPFKTIESELCIAPVDGEIIIKEQAPYQFGFRGITRGEANELQYKIKV